MDTLTFDRANIRLSRMWAEARDVRTTLQDLAILTTKHPKASSLFFSCLKLVFLEMTLNVSNYEHMARYQKLDDEFGDDLLRGLEATRDAESLDVLIAVAGDLRTILWGYANSRFGHLYEMLLEQNHGCIPLPTDRQKLQVLGNCVYIVLVEITIRYKELVLLEKENP